MNTDNGISRRRFVQLAAVAGAATLARPLSYAQGGAMTARQMVDQIKAKIGVPWDEKSYRDTFKMGDPDTPVKGVAATFMSTLNVIQRANQAGLNFVITHEPTLWSDADTLTDAVLDDPLYKFKKEYVDKNQMVVWRIHDHWHARTPEPMGVAWNKVLGWEQYAVPGTRTYKMPPTPLKTLAAHVAAKLESRSVRMVGDPELIVTKLGHGGHTLVGNIQGLAPDDVDAVVTSEAREVDSEEYVRDLSLSGKKKGMILIAHEAGEEAGMVLFTEWFPTIIPAVKIVNIPTTDRMWIA
jgi:putative NIF3 family GTP cyclohydrolase 1 type 2